MTITSMQNQDDHRKSKHAVRPCMDLPPPQKSLCRKVERRAKLPSNAPALTRKELTELIGKGLEASSLDDELFGTQSKWNNDYRTSSNEAYPSTTTTPKIKSKTKKSAEEIFYATMNGDALSVDEDDYDDHDHDDHEDDHHHHHHHHNVLDTHEGLYFSDDTDHDIEEFEEYPDSNSFACFDLIKDERMGELLKPENPISRLSKIRLSKNKKTKNKGKTSSHGNASEESSTGETTTASSSIPSGGDDLSIEDIKHFVMEQLSDDVKNMISDDAWGKILNECDHGDIEEEHNDGHHNNDDHDDDGTMMTSKSTKQALKQLLASSSRPATRKKKIDIDEVDGDDHISVSSDITTNTTTTTGILNKKGEKPKRVSFQMENDGSSPNEHDSAASSRMFSYPSPLSEEETRQRSVSSSTRTGKKKGMVVNFSDVTVRYYERVLELNPSVTNGPPIGIGWNFRKERTITVDEWEIQKKSEDQGRMIIKRPHMTRGKGGPNSASSHLLLPRSVRENMLYEVGYTQKDIAHALRIVRKVKDQRRTTVDNLNAQSVEEAVENATALMKNILRVGRRRGLVR